MSSSPSKHPSRRALLRAIGLGVVPASGLAAATQAPQGEVPKSSEDMAALGRLAGIEFTAAERQQAEKRLERQRNEFAELRKRPVGFDLPPCTAFDPVPTGDPLPPTGPGAGWEPRAGVAMPATDTDLAFASVDELASLLRQGRVTSRRLCELALQRLQKFDEQLHCVVSLVAEPALAQADAMDRELAAGKPRGPLHGIPFGAKDLFAWPGTVTTFGAAPYKEHRWELESTVLARLRDAGAVLTAKLSLGALAMGDLWFGGRTRNPWQPDQGSSGSSAGPAAAVAAGLVPFALAGLRPTFGTVSRHGAMPLSWTMDKVGPIARSAVDAALVFDAIRGADGRDPAARTAAFPWRRGRGLEGLRLGVLTGERALQREEDRAFLAWLEQQGGKPVPVTLPEAPYAAMLLMLHVEAATAFDDLLRSGALPQLDGQADGDWPNQFRTARCVPAVEYLRAARLRSELQRAMAKTMAAVDVLVAPTHGGPTLACTNLTGHPTYVLPVGRSDRDGGRPTVLALVGRLYGEAEVLALAEAWQETTRWHQGRPALTA
jgi:Asp-tRNA(Asn)/Glu-tRNA(Gln) amidotransferase A subunit family amidase